MNATSRADLTLINGKIITMNAGAEIVPAVAVKDGKIIAVGTTAGIRRIAGKDTKIIDLKGKTVSPGFIESHCHPNSSGTSMLFEAALGEARSMDDILEMLLEKKKNVPEGKWLRGRGYDDQRLREKRHPTRWDLDKVSTRHPVYIVRTDGHLSVGNSEALRLAGISRDTPEPAGGRIDRDGTSGEPNGLLRESAQAFIRKIIPPYTVAERKEGIIVAQKKLASWGITSYGDAGVDHDAFVAYQELLNEGKLLLRAALMMQCLVRSGGSYLKELATTGFKAGFGNERLRILGAKMFCDGSMSGWTAALHEPYANMPTERGMIVFGEKQLHKAIYDAHKAGLRPIVHAIGDRAIDITLDGIEKALRDYSASDHRMRIEHCSLPTERAIARMKRLRVMPGSSVGFIYELGPAHYIGLGEGRMKYYFPHKTYVKEGIIAAGNSDWHVTSANIANQLYSVVTRKGYNGQVIGGEQALPVMEALKLYTINAAYASFEERIKGSIEVGKLADFTVLDRDILTIPQDDLINMKPEMTIVGGAIIYDRNTT
ncbi:MAG: amidohydrolase [Chloroflexota bacterium]